LFDGAGTPWYIAFDQNQLKYSRPFLIYVYDSSEVTLVNFNVLNSPSFNVMLSNVQNAEVAHLNITCEWYDGGTKEPHNTDGIDVGSGSSNVHIHDCYIYNGDDSVAIKPGNVADCTTNILVENCKFYRGHGASIGSIPSGCVTNVLFRNLEIHDQLAGCNLKTYATGTGFVQNITWDTVTLTGTDYCLHINTAYTDPLVKGVTDTIKISDINFRNIMGTTCHYPAVLECQASSPCEGITLDNVNVASGASVKNMECTNAHGTSSKVQPPSCLQP